MPIVTAPALPVTDAQRVELTRMAGSTALPHRQVVQAKALLWAAEGVANQEIARRCEVDRMRCGGGGPGSPRRVSTGSG